MLIVREFEMARDGEIVEEMELRCELSPTTTSGCADGNKEDKRKEEGFSLVVDQMGDPMCRIRHTGEHVMLVAEYGKEKEIVGVVRACAKVVTRGMDAMNGTPLFAKVAYILGLRVSPAHRRQGIGSRLVEAAEEWSRQRGVEYAYMATEPTNAASLGLFTGRLGYSRHRSPSILARPVHAHRLPVSDTILRLPPPVAAALYRRIFLESEFFPAADIADILSHPLTLSTFIAIPRSAAHISGELPESFAIMSLWDNTRVFRLRAAGPSAARARRLLALVRAVDERAPWMRVPSVRDVTRPFGVYVMYGLHAQGPAGPGLLRGLCHLAHNIAVDDAGCAAVVAEVSGDDPAAAAIPHWKSFSSEEDAWCMKRLVATAETASGYQDNWAKAQPTSNVIFVDPRDF